MTRAGSPVRCSTSSDVPDPGPGRYTGRAGMDGQDHWQGEAHGDVEVAEGRLVPCSKHGPSSAFDGALVAATRAYPHGTFTRCDFII